MPGSYGALAPPDPEFLPTIRRQASPANSALRKRVTTTVVAATTLLATAGVGYLTRGSGGARSATADSSGTLSLHALGRWYRDAAATTTTPSPTAVARAGVDVDDDGERAAHWAANVGLDGPIDDLYFASGVLASSSLLYHVSRSGARERAISDRHRSIESCTVNGDSVYFTDGVAGLYKTSANDSLATTHGGAGPHVLMKVGGEARGVAHNPVTGELYVVDRVSRQLLRCDDPEVAGVGGGVSDGGVSGDTNNATCTPYVITTIPGGSVRPWDVAVAHTLPSPRIFVSSDDAGAIYEVCPRPRFSYSFSI